jgi:hypothetical protein
MPHADESSQPIEALLDEAGDPAGVEAQPLSEEPEPEQFKPLLLAPQTQRMVGGKVNFDQIKKNIFERSPLLAKHDFNIEQVDHKSRAGGSIEFLPVGETGDPNFPKERGNDTDKPLIRVFQDFTTNPEEAQSAVMGDLLHNLAIEDPVRRGLRQAYLDARDERQIEFDKEKYAKLVKEGKETRSFEQWMDISWADASIREPLKGNKEWLGFQTPEQVQLLNQMQNYLSTGEPPVKDL